MAASQRSALLDLCAAILRCDCASADIRFRAGSLQFRLAFDASSLRSMFA